MLAQAEQIYTLGYKNDKEKLSEYNDFLDIQEKCREKQVKAQ